MSYPAMIEAGVDVRLGTDGAASNNALDMRAEMKAASLIQDGCIPVIVALNQTGRFHFGAHIESIVAGRTICSQSNIDAGFNHSWIRHGTARGQFLIAHRAVDSVDLVLGQNPHLTFGNPTTVGANRPFLEVVNTVEIFDGIHAMLSMTIGHLLAGFRCVDTERTPG